MATPIGAAPASSLENNPHPFEILKTWLKEAEAHPEIKEPHAMVLSTLNYGQGKARWWNLWWPALWMGAVVPRVSSRVVLLKEITENNLIFYTNYKSIKARQMRQTTGAWGVALNFYWQVLGRQVRLEGTVRKTSKQKSLQYWNTRPFESQISQFVSQQSRVLNRPEDLHQEWEKAKKQFYGKGKVPCPAHWGGYAFTPFLMEFWMEKPHRLHDRVRFVKKPWPSRAWQARRLYP